MKPVASFVFAAALVVSTAAGAKTINSSVGGSNDQSVAGVAGPTAAAKASHKTPDKMSAKAKTKVRTAQTQKRAPVRATD